eukprot:6201784-Pleurochrysis_carterae.AAC.2
MNERHTMNMRRSHTFQSITSEGLVHSDESASMHWLLHAERTDGLADKFLNRHVSTNGVARTGNNEVAPAR